MDGPQSTPSGPPRLCPYGRLSSPVGSSSLGVSQRGYLLGIYASAAAPVLHGFDIVADGAQDVDLEDLRGRTLCGLHEIVVAAKHAASAADAAKLLAAGWRLNEIDDDRVAHGRYSSSG